MKLLQQCMLFLSLLTIFQILFLFIVFSNLAETDERLKEAQYSNNMAVKASAIMRGAGEYVVTTVVAQASSQFDNLIAREQFEELSRQVPDEFDSLCQLSKQNPEDHKDALAAKENFDYLKNDIEDCIKKQRSLYDLSYMISLRDQGRLGSIPRLMDINSSLSQITKRHSDYAGRLAALEKEQQDKFRLIIVGTIGLIILSSALVLIGFSRRVTGRLAQIVDNFWRFERKEQLSPEQKGEDEIARVDQSFRALAQQLENASEKEKAIFLHMPNGLIVCGANGSIEKLNPIAESMLGGTSAELFGVSLSKFLSPLFEYTTADGTIDAIPKPGHYLVNFESNTPVELTANAFQVDNSLKYLLVLVDITAKLEVDRMKEEFLSIVSHDLQTPLTSIMACITMVKLDEALSDRSLRNLDLANSAGHRLIRLTKDLLNVAKADAGQIVLDCERASCVELSEQAVADVAALASKKEIEILNETLDLVIEVDTDKVCQILVNLLSNAIKYSADGTTITIRTENIDDGVKFSVIDQGRGVPEDAIEHVFDKFKQVYRGDSNKGTGLGLAICKLFTEAHGGKIGVVSEVGSGSTFWLWLPRSPRQQRMS
ncbi:MAG: hypothetical protein K2X93_00830 [Candidatus Obscuribacterales bacterium]|nr:hypothetical protein [Candidatus Obscuribacterales bacterium]